MHEHTADEYQNITYLEKLAKASIGVDWNSLPTVRKIGLDEEVLRKHGSLISELKKSAFAIDVKVVREDGGGVSLQCDLEDGDIKEI
jgi:hypothetical protein